MNIQTFKKNVWNHYTAHGRHDLPWRKNPTPYRVLVSEIMLQQTQVERVIPKYHAFLRQFPSFKALANASLRDVLRIWQGLGYNRRARNLKRTAEIITQHYHGRLPKDEKTLQELPGIGPYTAGALSAFAFNTPAVFIETNIRTVFLNTFYPTQHGISDKELLPLIKSSLDRENPREWYYALMDYGTHIKAIKENPNRRSTHYTRQSPFKGSNRELRGKLLKLLLHRSYTASALIKKVALPSQKVHSVLAQLKKDGLVKEKGGVFSIT